MLSIDEELLANSLRRYPLLKPFDVGEDSIADGKVGRDGLVSSSYRALVPIASIFLDSLIHTT
jgi:hypothetical protein